MKITGKILEIVADTVMEDFNNQIKKIKESKAFKKDLDKLKKSIEYDKIETEINNILALQKVIKEDIERWNAYVENYQKINWIEFKEDEDKTSIMASAACAGGACEIEYSIKDNI